MEILVLLRGTSELGEDVESFLQTHVRRSEWDDEPLLVEDQTSGFNSAEDVVDKGLHNGSGREGHSGTPASVFC